MDTGLFTGRAADERGLARLRRVRGAHRGAAGRHAGAPRLPTDPGDEVAAAYDAPFPNEASKAGARAFPAILPLRPRWSGRRGRAARARGAAGGRAADADAAGATEDPAAAARRPARRSRARSGRPRPAGRRAPAHYLQEDQGAGRRDDRRLARRPTGGWAAIFGSSAAASATTASAAGALLAARCRRPRARSCRPSAATRRPILRPSHAERPRAQRRRARRGRRALRHVDVEARRTSARRRRPGDRPRGSGAGRPQLGHARDQLRIDEAGITTWTSTPVPRSSARTTRQADHAVLRRGVGRAARGAGLPAIEATLTMWPVLRGLMRRIASWVPWITAWRLSSSWRIRCRVGPPRRTGRSA